ncbi:tol-pal system protein YbgF [Corticibacterium sp. UT-5YL-CI-8]|nr:tol-pal system protein YbgF [Tianweitania sp. UT-5YL-CI-8]
MIFRSILSGTLALLLLSGAGAHARSGLETTNPVPSVGLPGVFGALGRSADTGTFQMAQAGDPRVTQLEEQIRRLSGTIEELNFQILQMQEQMRKMQEDNEFRFQELEKKSDASGGSNRTVAGTSPQSGGAITEGGGTSAASGSDDNVQDIIAGSGGTEAAPATNGAPPRTFGTITVDKNGNVIESGASRQLPPPSAPPAQAQSAPPAPSGNSQVAALPSTNDPSELYRNAYQFVLSGDYNTAEQGFRDHIDRFPNDPQTADARFWLGEAQLGQKKYRDAAETFLTANKTYPKSKKAPEMLLKLGVSLAGLKQRDVACATFSEVTKRYPNISDALKERVKQERAQASC